VTTTDVFGKARLTYSMRKEPANGSGDQQAASPIMVAVVDMRALMSAMYLVPPAALAFISGERTAFSVALLEWHEGTLILELEIDSTVTPTLVSGYGVVQGKATANGRIQLSRGDATTGPWTGDGTLSSQTTSGTGGCPGVHIAGQGAYDWVVRAAIAGPEVTNAADIAVDMDAGPGNEQPDQFTLNDCVTSFSGQMNTWENQFFTAYRHLYGANGLHIGDWSLQATADTWKTGGLVATATWSGTCATNLSPLEQMAFACTDATTFKLWAVVP
jgi:hypothetical protein